MKSSVASGVDPEKVKVVYPGISPTSSRLVNNVQSENIRTKYGIGDGLHCLRGIYKATQESRSTLAVLSKISSNNGHANLVSWVR